MCHYNTPALDLCRILYNAVEPDVRRYHYMDLVETYHASLRSALRSYRYLGRAPRLRQLLDELERVSEFGLAFGIVSYAVITADVDNPVDINLLIATDGKEGVNMEIYERDIIRSKVGEDVVDLIFLHNFTGKINGFL